jgi:hypothetical protein
VRGDRVTPLGLRRQREARARVAVSAERAQAVEVWSVYGAERSQSVATGDKCDGGECGSNRQKPLPWVATSCHRVRMVRRSRRFESVRGLYKDPQIVAFSVGPTCTSSGMRWAWSPLWSFQIQPSHARRCRTSGYLLLGRPQSRAERPSVRNASQSDVTAVKFMVSNTPGFGSSRTPITVRAGR